MYLWIAVGFVILATLGFLAWLPLRIKVWIRRQHGDDEGAVEVFYLFGLVRWKRKLLSLTAKKSDEGPSLAVEHGPVDAQTGKSKGPNADNTSTSAKQNHTELTTEEVWRALKNWSHWKRVFDGVRPILKRLLRHTWFSHCDIQMTVGTSDVVSTGLAYGTAWSLATGIIGPLTYWANFSDKPTVNLTADFHQARFEGSARCIVKVRLGYAIFAGLRLARVWKNAQAEKEET